MISHTREIAQEDWTLFFDSTSRHYQGRNVKVEVLGPEVGIHVIAEGLSLMGMTFERHENAASEIQIIAGDPDKGHVSHVISGPRHVWIEQEVNGGDNAIEIQGTGGNAVIIELSATHGRQEIR